MNFTFENQGTNTYLVYAIGADDTVDTMSLGMLTNNKISGLAPAIFTQMDTTKYIKYNVSAHISVKQFFSGPVNKKRLIGVFNGIVDAMMSAEDYMIDVDSIIVDLDYIFADVSTCETFLICLPIVSTERTPVDLGMFFKNIMFSTQFDQTENCDHVAKIMNYLNSTPVFSLTDFKELLRSVDAVEQPVVQTVVKQQPVQQTQPVQTQPAKAEQPKTVPAQSVVAKTIQAPPTQNQPTQTPPMQVPPAQTPPVQAKAATPASSEKKMSMLDLLMHYNKENAEIYKAQKAAQKGAKPTSAPAAPKTAYAVPGQPTTPAPKTSFAVPGQPAAPMQKKSVNGFAIPGQPTNAAIPNKGFAVPGQPAAPVTPAVQPKAAPQKVQTQTATNTPPVVQQPTVAPQQTQYQAPVVPQGRAMNFGETTVLGGGNIGETTVLGAAPTAAEPKPYLIRTKNNEKINLNKPVFRIGKEKSYVDYFIGDNTAISRSHANFITRDGQYFVMDTNSTNHTYVNGVMIQSNIETQLSHGDKVRLANEDFDFKLY